jgi:tRNA threonylcarbamoyladenosine biosynthesis protein TsaB
MNVLAIDTSHPNGSASVRAGGRRGSIRLERASSHLVELGRALSTLLSMAGVGISDIDRAAIVTGPGSFTGLRVGMAYLKGLYAARPLEVVGMTSLELLARQAAEEGKAVSPMIDARKNEVYTALYEARRPIGLVEKIGPCVVAPEQHVGSIPRLPTVFVGTGALRYRELIETAFGSSAHVVEENRCYPDTALLCRLAEDLTPMAPDRVVALEPFYVRPSDVTLQPLKGVCAYDRS